MPADVWHRADGTSSEEEEESDDEPAPPPRRAMFRIAGQPAQPAATPQEARSQLVQEIKQVTTQSEAVVSSSQQQSSEKTEQEKKALEERQKLLEAQRQAQAAQAAAMQQAAAARQPTEAKSEADAERQAAIKRQQEEALKKAQEAQQRAQAEAKARQEAALKQAQEAQARAQADAKARQEAALKQAQEAQAKAQADAKARQEAAQKQAQEAQAKAQADAKARQEAAQKQAQEAQAKAKAAQEAQAQAKKAQQEAQAKAQAQAQAQAKQQQAQQQQKPAPVPAQQGQTRPQQQQQQQQPQPVQQPLGKAPPVKTQEPNLGSQATSHSVKQPIKEPGKLSTPAQPQAEVPKEAAQLPGNTALKQTAKAQESSMSDAPLHPVHTAALAGVNAQKPTVKQTDVEKRFVEKEEAAPEKQKVARGGLLAGAQKWEQDSAVRESEADMTLERGPAGIRLQDDACWQTQKRVAPEIEAPPIGRVTIPEFSDEHEVQKTIVAKPVGFQKVAWNEFPEEKQIERISAPRVKTQEWTPVNNEEMEVLRTTYNPGRVSAVWPPPQEEIIKDGGDVTRVKTGDDQAWIQQEQHEVLRFAPKTSRINRAWPPPEDELSKSSIDRSQLGPVVWPPPETEEKEKEAVDTLHKTLPVGHIERQWPPAPPQYTLVPQRSPLVETQQEPTTAQQEMAQTVVTTTQVVRQPMAAK